eukprot:TRINITY_DN1912_c0_g2_i1.p1 TRINITY_DN1912_c0_g2~~TRINITY_DN1912_c0_g2_i1.p1  ORF type:complete len:303 (-),score=62.66 TRINITY_DN1912_c0_g2_i1:1279-2187(-)
MGGCGSTAAHPIPTGTRPSGPEYFTSRTTGLNVYTKQWLVENPRAAVLVLHGFGEHCHRYEHFAVALNKHRYSVFTMDHQGHGRSEGLPAHVQRFAHYVDDVFQHVGLIKDKIGDLPLFLFGHSMGGAIATSTLIRDQSPFKGAMLSGPAIMPKPEVARPHLVFMAEKLSNTVPTLGVEALDIRFISRDPEVVKKAMEDPYSYHGKMRVRWADEMMKTMTGFQTSIKTIKLPFIVMQGTDDMLVNPEGAKFLYENASSQDKQYQEFEGLYHEILNEPEKEKVIERAIEWFNTHCDETFTLQI